jgi:uncharacterized repeat protein (TIGR02543 family)
MAFGSVGLSQGTYQVDNVSDGTQIRTLLKCNFGVLTKGDAASVTVTAQPVAAGTLTNAVAVTGAEPDPNTFNNTFSSTLTVVDTTPPVSGYALTTSVFPTGVGTITLDPVPGADGKYADGTQVILTVNPAAGYVFSGWSRDLSGSANPVSITMIGNKIVTAHFAPTPIDVTQPGDPITATSNNSPTDEVVTKAIDNQAGTKYLNFDKLNAGFTVTPSVGATIVTGLGLTSANDSPERDPASYRLEGSLDGKIFTLIAAGTVSPFTARFKQQNLYFVNTTAYVAYRLIFPTVANAGTANCMQIGEVELFGLLAQPPAIVFTWTNGALTMSWDPTATGYTLETTMNLRPPVVWTAVPKVVDNRISVSARTGTSFYRLRR